MPYLYSISDFHILEKALPLHCIIDKRDIQYIA